MDFWTWVGFAGASMALLVIPGPTILLVMSYAVGQGRRVAMSCALGVGLGDLVAMSASLAGLGALVATSAAAFTVLKWCGAAYLAWLGWRMWRGAGAARFCAAERPEPASACAVFGHAALVTALNPKSIAFFIAFVPQFVDASAPLTPQFTVLVATFVGLATLNALVFALLADGLRARLRRPAVLRWITRGGAAALMAMAAATVLTRRTA